jgi:hypothetical protein
VEAVEVRVHTVLRHVERQRPLAVQQLGAQQFYLAQPRGILLRGSVLLRIVHPPAPHVPLAEDAAPRGRRRGRRRR